MKVVMFSKHLQEYSVEDAGKAAKAIGFDGLDLTVRPGGHVSPEEVEEALPRAVDTLDRIGMAVPMLTTAITDVDPHAEAIFWTAKKLGIRFLKLGYWRYPGFGRLREAMDDARAALERLEPLALETSVTACLHIHSADFLTASPHVVAELLKGLNAKALGAYADPGHMTLEGGRSGWKIGLDALKDRVQIVSVKSFGWFRHESEDGKVRWEDKLVPLREGIVRWEEVFECLRAMRFNGIVSFHSEYQGGHSWRDLTVEELLEQTREDYEFLRPLLGR